MVWVDSGSWWWTGRPGMLWFVGSQRVGRDWVTELNWTECRRPWFNSWVRKICWSREKVCTSVFLGFVAQLIKNLPAVRETWVWFLSWEDTLEKGKATHSSILAWRIPWTVYSMGLQRIRYDWVTFTFHFDPGRMGKVLEGLRILVDWIKSYSGRTPPSWTGDTFSCTFTKPSDGSYQDSF